MSHLNTTAADHDLALGHILGYVVLLRAINERKRGEPGWTDVAKRVGYVDASGLRKLVKRTLDVPLEELEDQEPKVLESLRSLLSATS